MPIHAIFDEAPKQFSEDFVGRVRTGTQLNGRPMALTEFRFTTGDPAVAQAIADEFGGTPNEWPSNKEDNIEVITTANRIEIQLLTLRSGYNLWSGQNVLIRSCDGQKQNDGSDCFCKSTYSSQQEMNAASKQGIACGPEVRASFKLAKLPDLGIWNFQNQSKTLAYGDPSWKRDKLDEGEVFSPPIQEVEDAFKAIGSGATATLELVGVSYKTKAGQAVSYTKPVLTIGESVAA